MSPLRKVFQGRKFGAPNGNVHPTGNDTKLPFEPPTERYGNSKSQFCRNLEREISPFSRNYSPIHNYGEFESDQNLFLHGRGQNKPLQNLNPHYQNRTDQNYGGRNRMRAQFPSNHQVKLQNDTHYKKVNDNVPQRIEQRYVKQRNNVSNSCIFDKSFLNNTEMIEYFDQSPQTQKLIKIKMEHFLKIQLPMILKLSVAWIGLIICLFHKDLVVTNVYQVQGQDDNDFYDYVEEEEKSLNTKLILRILFATVLMAVMMLTSTHRPQSSWGSI